MILMMMLKMKTIISLITVLAFTSQHVAQGSAKESEVVAKDVWWPSPNCGPKEVYVD